MIKKELGFFIFFFHLLNAVVESPHIPKIMHTIWLGKELPTKFHMFRLNWAKKHPEWMHILWVDDSRNYIYSLDKKCSELTAIFNKDYLGKLIVIDIKTLDLNKYETFRNGNYNQKSDIARFFIIDKFGGAYINADCECRKSLNSIHEITECYVSSTKFKNHTILSNALFGATSNHPAIKECLNYALTNSITNDIGSMNIDVQLFESLLRSKKITIVPSFYFFPLSIDQKDLKDEDKNKLVQDKTICICHWKERFHDHASQDNKHVIGLHTGPEGLFSELKGTLNHLFYCARFNKTPVVYWDKSSCYYQEEGYNGSHNVWEYYFEQVSDQTYSIDDHIWHLYGSPDGTGIQVEAESNREKPFRKMVKSLMDRYIKIKPSIEKKVNDFYDTHMKNMRTIGIHIRHTDRINDPMKVPFLKIIEEVNKYADGKTQFLVATDEEQFLEEAKTLLKGKVISYQSYRSKDGTPIHLSRTHNYSKAILGEEALIEVLLLSRCDKFFHTISNFSYGALIFNPDLDNILLSNDLLKKSENKSVIQDKYVIRSWHAGFFSNFFAVLNHLEICEQNNKTPVIYWYKESRYFIPEGFNGSYNAWEYYFEPVSNLKHVPDDQIHWDFFVGSTLFGEKSIYDVREKAHNLIKRYIRINHIVQKKVNDFYCKYLTNKRTIGIHYRGTDKCEEVKPVSFEKYVNLANEYKDCQFLVASDDQKFIDEIKGFFGDRVVCYDCCRSQDGKPIHRNKPEHAKSIAQLGEDVLVEVLLLSKCDLLIHSLSNVSTAALYFNPVMPHILLKGD